MSIEQQQEEGEGEEEEHSCVFTRQASSSSSSSVVSSLSYQCGYSDGSMMHDGLAHTHAHAHTDDFFFLDSDSDLLRHSGLPTRYPALTQVISLPNPVVPVVGSSGDSGDSGSPNGRHRQRHGNAIRDSTSSYNIPCTSSSSSSSDDDDDTVHFSSCFHYSADKCGLDIDIDTDTGGMHDTSYPQSLRVAECATSATATALPRKKGTCRGQSDSESDGGAGGPGTGGGTLSDRAMDLFFPLYSSGEVLTTTKKHNNTVSRSIPVLELESSVDVLYSSSCRDNDNDDCGEGDDGDGWEESGRKHKKKMNPTNIKNNNKRNGEKVENNNKNNGRGQRKMSRHDTIRDTDRDTDRDSNSDAGDDTGDDSSVATHNTTATQQSDYTTTTSSSGGGSVSLLLPSLQVIAQHSTTVPPSLSLSRPLPPVPLSPDALSSFGRSDPLSRECDQDVREATSLLVQRLVPAMALDLLTKVRCEVEGITCVAAAAEGCCCLCCFIGVLMLLSLLLSYSIPMISALFICLIIWLILLCCAMLYDILYCLIHFYRATPYSARA